MGPRAVALRLGVADLDEQRLTRHAHSGSRENLNAFCLVDSVGNVPTGDMYKPDVPMCAGSTLLRR